MLINGQSYNKVYLLWCDHGVTENEKILAINEELVIMTSSASVGSFPCHPGCI